MLNRRLIYFLYMSMAKIKGIYGIFVFRYCKRKGGQGILELDL